MFNHFTGDTHQKMLAPAIDTGASVPSARPRSEEPQPPLVKMIRDNIALVTAQHSYPFVAGEVISTQVQKAMLTITKGKAIEPSDIAAIRKEHPFAAEVLDRLRLVTTRGSKVNQHESLLPLTLTRDASRKIILDQSAEIVRQPPATGRQPPAASHQPPSCQPRFLLVKCCCVFSCV